MVSLYDSIQSLDSKVWHGLEKLAYKHSKASRLLALPLAIGAFIKGNLVAPAICIDSIALTVKNINAYRIEKDDKEKRINISKSIVKYSGKAVGYAILTPLSPLCGIITAIDSLIKVGFSPFKSAKVEAARHDFNLFVRQKGYDDKEVFIDHPITKMPIRINFANEKAFAQANFNRFKKKVHHAVNNEGAKNIRFLDKDSKKDIKEEIKLKKEALNRSYEIYTKEYNGLVQEYTEKVGQSLDSVNKAKCLDEYFKKINETIKNWKKYQEQLIAAYPSSEPYTLYLNKKDK